MFSQEPLRPQSPPSLSSESGQEPTEAAPSNDLMLDLERQELVAGSLLGNKYVWIHRSPAWLLQGRSSGCIMSSSSPPR